MNYQFENSESIIQSLEFQVERLEHMLPKIKQQLQTIAQSIENLEKTGDQETASTLQSNLQSKREEHHKLQEEVARTIRELDEVEKQLTILWQRNEESKEEIVALRAIGEDVDEAIKLTSERDELIRLQELK